MNIDVLNIPVRTIDGEDTRLEQYKGDVLMIVNVASKCGLTPQYAGLESIYERFRDRGFQVLGFPANDFAGQEPGTNEEVKSFCELNYGVDFPMFQKIPVVGENKHPLYRALIEAQPKAIGDSSEFRQHLIEFGVSPNADPELLWNFEKFLVNRQGEVVGRYAPDMEPDNPVIVQAIEKELNAA